MDTATTPGMKKYFMLGSLLAILCMVGDTSLSAQFGFTISNLMGVVLGAISLASGLLLTLAAYFLITGNPVLAKIIAAVWVPVFMFNVVSNMGVATSSRMGEVQNASIQKTRHADKSQAKDEARDRLTIFTKRRDELIKQRGWTAAVPVGLIQAKVDAHPGIKANIWRRTKSCTDATIPKSIAYCEQYAALKVDLASAKAIVDLNKQITATESILDKARTTLATTDAGVSAASNQSLLYAKWLGWNNDPSATQVGSANESIGIFLAAILAMVSMIMTLASAWPHLMEANRLYRTGGLKSEPKAVKPKVSLQERMFPGTAEAVQATQRAEAQPVRRTAQANPSANPSSVLDIQQMIADIRMGCTAQAA